MILTHFRRNRGEPRGGESATEVMRLAGLGRDLLDRYESNGRLQDLEHAIDAYEQAVRQSPADSPKLAPLLHRLGLALRKRYLHTGEIAHLDRAVELQEQALGLVPTESADRPIFTNRGPGRLQDPAGRLLPPWSGL